MLDRVLLTRRLTFFHEDAMARNVNFDNGSERFQYRLDAQGNLNFNANDFNGSGDRRLSIARDSGQLTVGGDGQSGALQLTSSANGNTIFIGAGEQNNAAVAILVSRIL